MFTYQNPVIKGFNPDPSVCRAGEDYYLVTSTFEYFPGVPVYHSRNLTDWRILGHCLTRKSQLDLTNAKPSGGIYAPTIRHHNGLFYMTTTNVSHKGNFIVTASDPGGEWSEPAWIEQPGIDPSLFFDEDGTAYFTSTATIGGRTGIYLCTVDPDTCRQTGASVFLTAGGGGRCAEAPHIYKKSGFYYLLLAEGGTEYGHMVTIFRGKAAAGPYLPCPHNPILTHRGMNAQNNPIQCTGHADLFEDGNGNWWMAALGVRTLPGAMLHNLGRETFLAPVVWNDGGWPVAGDDGIISLSMTGPLPAPQEGKDGSFTDSFSSESTPPEYLFIRNPDPSRYKRQSGSLTLRGNGAALSGMEGEPPVFLGIRQREFDITAEVTVTLTEGGSKGGMTAYYGPDYYYAVYLIWESGRTYVQTARRVHAVEALTDRVPIPGGTTTLRIVTGKNFYELYYLDEAGCPVRLASGATAGLCTEGTAQMTFTGTLLGMFCETGTAVFREFSLT